MLDFLFYIFILFTFCLFFFKKKKNHRFSAVHSGLVWSSWGQIVVSLSDEGGKKNNEVMNKNTFLH